MAELGSFDRLRAALADRYRIERELGSGGMATVYLAEDLKHHRQVAIKVLKPELAALLGPERFLREIEIAAGLTHPHILPLHDSGKAAGFLYFVMPRMEGESLRQRLDREPRLSVEEAIAITTAVASALDSAHRHGVIHRDIKPENILLQDGEPMIGDFGIAFAVNAAAGVDRLTDTGISLGTPYYMSPEQATGARVIDGRSDTYSLGCVLYEMLAGRPPTEGSTLPEVLAAKAMGRITPLRDLRPDLPDRLQRAVEKALAPAPEGRFGTAGEFGAEVARVIPDLADVGRRRIRRRVAAVAAGVVLVGAIAAAKLYADREWERWARTTALAEMQRLVNADRMDSMYALGVRVASLIPNDSEFVRVWRTMAFPTAIRTDPPGAKVFRRPYDDADTSSLYLGTTPLDSLPLPWFGSRLRLEHAGYHTQDVVAVAFGPTITVGGSLLAERTITLDPLEAAPEGMVRVAGFALPQTQLNLPEPMAVGDFWLGRYEVTNRQYREFVDAGGYQKREYWSERLVRNGGEVSWEEAMRLFVDRTGQPGPSTWQAGSYPEAQDDYPVGGVSWYEAAAYARFAGKRLPTYWHWRQGLPAGLLYLAAPRSNIARTGGPAPVGSYKGLGAFGTFDQSGNVREWVYNERTGERLIMGGGWNDPDWVTLNPVTASAWDRSAINGFRLARYLEDTPALSKAHEPVPARPPWREYRAERPAGPREVEIFKRLFSYDAQPLEQQVERSDSTRDWIRERVSFAAAYGSGRMAAYLYLPRRGRPPYQAVMYWPGSFALNNRHIDQLPERLHDFFVTAGRVVILPLYLGTFDRDDERFSLADGALPPATGSGRRDLVIQWVKDFRRTIDYLATRPDIDATRLGFFGSSWGGIHWPIVLAVEPRITAGISHVGGLDNVRWLPEIDPFNFLSAVRTPILMLASRYDPRFPFEPSQKPMFDLVGTPPEDKALFVYDAGSHFMPMDLVARESLAWLDRYLGPVRFAP